MESMKKCVSVKNVKDGRRHKETELAPYAVCSLYKTSCRCDLLTTVGVIFCVYIYLPQCVTDTSLPGVFRNAYKMSTK